ncbi:MAG: hypothetical protein KF779_09430 [Hyphomonadaceae bacterium]|nr:hypothetical protein [Hyphomonadaceae bacterium]
MSQVRAPIVTAASVEVFFTSALRLLSGLFSLILRVGWQRRSPRLTRRLSRAERAVECLLFLKAVALHPQPAQKRKTPRFTPRGFRRTTSRGRLLFRSAHIRAKKANAVDRVMALIEALMHPERAVHHFLKKLRCGLRSGRLVPAAPPSERLAHVIIALTRALLDTS